MISKAQCTGTTLALALAVSSIHPASLVAQESDLALDEPGVGETAPSPGLDTANDEDAVPTAEALQPTAANTDLLTVPLTAAPSLGADQPLATATAVQSGGGTGLGFMIAGGAALVGGLLIGGTAGNLIAAGGVALGVYGIIVYF
jgi:hypothetical protein